MRDSKNFYLWLLQIIGLLGLLALCLWLSLRPKEPTFSIVEFSVPTQDSSASEEDGTLSYTLEISNSNKDSSIYYDDILLIFHFGEDTVGKNKISAFHQGKNKKVREMNHVDATQQVRRALLNAISDGKAELKLDVSTKIQYNTWGVKNKHHGVKLQATVPVGSDGRILGKKKKIKLHHQSKKWKIRATRFL